MQKKKISFYDYIMATRLNGPSCLPTRKEEYYCDFAKKLCGLNPKLIDQFDFDEWCWFSHQRPELSHYNLAAYDLWQEYRMLSPEATLEQVIVPYYSTVQYGVSGNE